MVTFQRPAVPRFDEPAPNEEPVRVARAHTQPVPANVTTLFEMGRDSFFELRGIPLRTPVPPALEGAALYELRARIANAQTKSQSRDLTPKEYGEYTALVRELQKRITRLIRPVRQRDRVARLFGLWRPLKHAGEKDLGYILDFLLRLRAKSNTRFFSEMES